MLSGTRIDRLFRLNKLKSFSINDDKVRTPNILEAGKLSPLAKT